MLKGLNSVPSGFTTTSPPACSIFCPMYWAKHEPSITHRCEGWTGFSRGMRSTTECLTDMEVSFIYLNYLMQNYTKYASSPCNGSKKNTE